LDEIAELTVVLDFFFVFMHLMLNALDGQIDRMHQIFVLVDRDKIVLVLGIDFHFALLVNAILQVARDFDHGDSVEEMQQFFAFDGDGFLMLFVEMPMSGRDFHLHVRKSPCVEARYGFV
jgi:hypothetical protein